MQTVLIFCLELNAHSMSLNIRLPVILGGKSVLSHFTDEHMEYWKNYASWRPYLGSGRNRPCAFTIHHIMLPPKVIIMKQVQLKNYTVQLFSQ